MLRYLCISGPSFQELIHYTRNPGLFKLRYKSTISLRSIQYPRYLGLFENIGLLITNIIKKGGDFTDLVRIDSNHSRSLLRSNVIVVASD